MVGGRLRAPLFGVGLALVECVLCVLIGHRRRDRVYLANPMHTDAAARVTVGHAVGTPCSGENKKPSDGKPRNATLLNRSCTACLEMPHTQAIGTHSPRPFAGGGQRETSPYSISCAMWPRCQAARGRVVPLPTINFTRQCPRPPPPSPGGQAPKPSRTTLATPPVSSRLAGGYPLVERLHRGPRLDGGPSHIAPLLYTRSLAAHV